MSTKPILFNTDMVRALLANRKTVTRRVVKPQPICYGLNSTFEPHVKDFFLSADKNCLRCRVCGNDPEYSREGSNVVHHWIPPYRPGDILYVRETWQEVYETEFDANAPGSCVDIRSLIPNFDSIPKVKAGISTNCSCSAMAPRMKYYVFKASDIEYADPTNGLIWRPSIHMPREAARIFLRVTDVRAERLQDITELDILEKEGVTVDFPQPKPSYMSLAYTETRLKPAVRKAFVDLWNSTIKPADRTLYGWDANPWAWVIEFERISREEALYG